MVLSVYDFLWIAFSSHPEENKSLLNSTWHRDGSHPKTIEKAAMLSHYHKPIFTNQEMWYPFTIKGDHNRHLLIVTPQRKEILSQSKWQGKYKISLLFTSFEETHLNMKIEHVPPKWIFNITFLLLFSCSTSSSSLLCASEAVERGAPWSAVFSPWDKERNLLFEFPLPSTELWSFT